MAMIIQPSFDVSTPEKMSTFLHKHHPADPNAKKPVHAILAHDIISLDPHPCLISDPPQISHLEGLSGGGYEDPAEEKLVLVRGRSVVDGEEYDQLFGVDGGEVECFVDRHEEREWLVRGREGMRLYLQAPGDPSDTRVMWMQPEKKIPCFWLLARKMPGRVYFRIYSQMGFNIITGARDAPGFSA